MAIFVLYAVFMCGIWPITKNTKNTCFMKKQTSYFAPQSDVFIIDLEHNICLSGNVPSNSIADFVSVDGSDIDWDTE